MNKHIAIIKQLLRTLGIHDFEVTKLSKGHLRIESPMLTRRISVSSSPSDVRALKNVKADIKRAMK